MPCSAIWPAVLLNQVADLLLHQGFGQFHLQLLDQGLDQGVVAVGLAAALGVILEAGLKLAAQFGQGLLVAGLLGEGVVEGGQFAGLQLLEGDREAGSSRPAASCWG
jgi:hypothetical protein